MNIRVKIIKDHKEYRAGDTVVVSPNIAFGLIDSGYATLSKDLQPTTDYMTKAVKTRRMQLKGR